MEKHKEAASATKLCEQKMIESPCDWVQGYHLASL